MSTVSNGVAAVTNGATAVADTLTGAVSNTGSVVSVPVVNTINSYVSPKIRSYILLFVTVIIIMLVIIDFGYDKSGYLGQHLDSIFGRGNLVGIHAYILIALMFVYIIPDTIAAKKGQYLRGVSGAKESFFGGSWFGEDTTNKSHPYYTTGSAERYTVSDSSL